MHFVRLLSSLGEAAQAELRLFRSHVQWGPRTYPPPHHRVSGVVVLHCPPTLGQVSKPSLIPSRAPSTEHSPTSPGPIRPCSVPVMPTRALVAHLAVPLPLCVFRDGKHKFILILVLEKQTWEMSSPRSPQDPGSWHQVHCLDGDTFQCTNVQV